MDSIGIDIFLKVWIAVVGSKPSNDTMAEALQKSGASGFPVAYDELSKAVLEGLYMQVSYGLQILTITVNQTERELTLLLTLPLTPISKI
jgi:hypothetical protein